MLLLWQRFILFKLNLQIYMKIYDCFMFSDEKMILDIRLNVLNEHVDHFVIVESKYKHNGDVKNRNFDISQYSKFKNKIIYIYLDNEPNGLVATDIKNNENKKNERILHNTYLRENYQRNMISEGLLNAKRNDFIIISDIDEIPNLKKINFKEKIDNIFIFQQKMFYYKLNLFYKLMPWYGSKACKKKYFKSPQWLRSIKNKKYPAWRFDILFSQLKYNDIYYVENGGWHFTNVRQPIELKKKLSNFLHHVDFKKSGLDLEDLKRLMQEKKVMYNHKIDKRGHKWGEGEKLQTITLEEMPKYIIENTEKYRPWLDS